MPRIFVCPLSRLEETVRDSGARHVVTLMNAGTPVDPPPEIAPENHKFLGMNDIAAPIEGMVLPAEEHVLEFLEFVQDWDRRHPMVIHCWAGVSRSTAGAYTALCALRPDLDELEIAVRIRSRSPEATPNSKFVEIADELLERRGRMIHAVREIGRGENAFEGTVFSLELEEHGVIY